VASQLEELGSSQTSVNTGPNHEPRLHQAGLIDPAAEDIADHKSQQALDAVCVNCAAGIATLVNGPGPRRGSGDDALGPGTLAPVSRTGGGPSSQRFFDRDSGVLRMREVVVDLVELAARPAS
jgi:hypothetical protein